MVQTMRSSNAASSPGITGSHILEVLGYSEESQSTLNTESYTRILQHLAKLYTCDPAIVSSILSNVTSNIKPENLLGLDVCASTSSNSNVSSPSSTYFIPKPESDIAESEGLENDNHQGYTPEALDLSTQKLNSQSTLRVYPTLRRISIKQVKSKVVEDAWVENDVALSWTDSKIAAFNPAQKLFMCLDCEHVGFLSRVAEHWLGAHANLRVFHCPRCPYTSAWSRCVKMHLTRQHHEQFADTTMWKGNASLLEVTKLMQDLRTKVETCIDSSNLLVDKRFYCPHCPYATDRRDLFTRHENIHKDNKPFHCYLCLKQFNRADHVKKHFVRMHADAEYDMSKIRKAQDSRNDTSNTTEKPSTLHKGSLTSETRSSGLAKDNSNSKTQKILFSGISPMFTKKSSTSTPAKGSLSMSLTIPNSSSLDSGTVMKTRKRSEKAFSCHYCNWSGSDNWCLKRHMNTHIKPFACVMCDYKAARAERLSTHVLKVHNKRICNKCNFLSDTQEELQEHTREEHHNNPYSRRHICTSCGMSFDTKPNLETHLHLFHARPKSPADLVQITPIVAPATEWGQSEDALLNRDPASLMMFPLQELGKGELSKSFDSFHEENVTAKCPHCQYELKKDEISKDHWLTHHEDVCGACVHVFTSVYGPRLWKKVNAKSSSIENSLDLIVTGLNKKRPHEEDTEDRSKTSLQTIEFHMQRCTKRSRKQSYPKKVIAISQNENVSIGEKSSFTSLRLGNTTRKKFKRTCHICPHKPKFVSIAQYRLHKLRKHKTNVKLSKK